MTDRHCCSRVWRSCIDQRERPEPGSHLSYGVNDKGVDSPQDQPSLRGRSYCKPLSVRVSPTERLHAQVDELFDGDTNLAAAIEQVARLSVQLLLQFALEAEVGWRGFVATPPAGLRLLQDPRPHLTQPPPGWSAMRRRTKVRRCPKISVLSPNINNNTRGPAPGHLHRRWDATDAGV